MKKFVLIEVIERDISTPTFFETLTAAQNEMRARFEASVRSEDDDNACCDEMFAYCENHNHDNCDWKIYDLLESSIFE